MASERDNEYIIHQFDEYIGEDFGGMIFAEGYNALGGPRFRFIKNGAPPTGYGDMKNQVILGEGEMRILVAQTFGAIGRQRHIAEESPEPHSQTAQTSSIEAFQQMLRMVIREELEQFFKDHQVSFDNKHLCATSEKTDVDIAASPDYEPKAEVVSSPTNDLKAADSHSTETLETHPKRTRSRVAQNFKAVTVPQGVYEIGKDIPSGKVFLCGVSGETTPIVIIGKTLTNGQVDDEVFNQDVYDGINITLQSGNFVSVNYGPLVIKAAQTDFDFHKMSSSHKISVPQGLYEVGVEIPAGWYYLGCKPDETTPIVKIGTEIVNGELNEDLYDQDIGEGANLQLVDGTYISITYSAVLFEPRKFSFKSYASSKRAIIPQGIYEIGKDIPEGKYFFCGVEGKTTPIVKIGVSLEKGQVSYDFFDQDVYDGINVNVTEGTYMSVTYGPLVIEPFKAEVDFELE